MAVGVSRAEQSQGWQRRWHRAGKVRPKNKGVVSMDSGARLVIVGLGLGY